MNVSDAGGNPSTRTWGMTCDGVPDEGDYSLGRTKRADGYVIETLKVVKFKARVRRDKLDNIEAFKPDGEFQLEHRTVELAPYTIGPTSGWN